MIMIIMTMFTQSNLFNTRNAVINEGPVSQNYEYITVKFLQLVTGTGSPYQVLTITLLQMGRGKFVYLCISALDIFRRPVDTSWNVPLYIFVSCFSPKHHIEQKTLN